MTDISTAHGRAGTEGLELEERNSLRRVADLRTELDDITEVEYRQLLPRARRPGQRVDRGHRRGRRELAGRAQAARRDRRLRRCSTRSIQRRQKPDPATYIGSGKVEELRDVVVATGADTVICDGELAPGQLRNLEDQVKVKVIDRTALILDIFAQHAKSPGGQGPGRARPAAVPASSGCAAGAATCPGRPVAGSAGGRRHRWPRAR